VKLDWLFEFVSYERTRGHSLILKKRRINTELRRNFFWTCDKLVELTG